MPVLLSLALSAGVAPAGSDTGSIVVDDDRDAIRRAAAGGVQLVDDVVAVAEGERVGVVAKAAVERVDASVETGNREVDHQVVDVDDIVPPLSLLVPLTDEADRCGRSERPVQHEV